MVRPHLSYPIYLFNNIYRVPPSYLKLFKQNYEIACDLQIIYSSLQSEHLLASISDGPLY